VARGLVRWLPPRSRARGLFEIVLATAISVQALHAMMIEGFEAALDRYHRAAVYGSSLERLTRAERVAGERLLVVHSSA
jgi:hypothetical protein